LWETQFGYKGYMDIRRVLIPIAIGIVFMYKQYVSVTHAFRPVTQIADSQGRD